MNRIAILCTSSSWGSLELSVLNLSRWLQARGWEVTLMAKKGAALWELMNNPGIKMVDVAAPFGFGDVFVAGKIGSTMKSRQAKLLFVSSFDELNAAALAKKLSGGFKIALLQHLQPPPTGKGWKTRWELNSLDAWICPMNYMVDSVSRETGLSRDKIFVVPLGLEVKSLEKAQKLKQAARKHLQLPLDAYTVGMVGRLEEPKGQEYLIEALKILHKEGHKFHLLFVGEHSKMDSETYFRKIKEILQMAGLVNYVHFRPHQQAQEYVYGAFDLYVHAATFEVYGMAVLEAMTAKLPIVAVDSGGLSEILTHERNALLTPPQNPNALAEAILRLKNDDALAQKISEQALSDVTERFSNDTQCRLIEALLHKLVG